MKLIYKNQLVFFSLFLILSSSVVKSQNLGEITWSYETGDKIYASPVIHNSVLYVGSLDNYFYAIDASTGEKLWEYNTGNAIMSNAAISDSVICFESGNVLYALDLEGNLLWQFEMETKGFQDRADYWDYHHSSPIVHNEIVYCCTVRGYLFGININDGSKVLEYQTESKQNIRTSPVIKDDYIYFGDWQGIFYCHDITTNQEVWKFNTKDEVNFNWKNTIHSNPIIVGDNVIFSGRFCGVFSRNCKTGAENWFYKSPTDQWYVGGPVESDGILYFGSSDQFLVSAINLSDGSLVWTHETDGRIWGPPCVEDDILFFGAVGFYAIDKTNGNLISKIDFPKVTQDQNIGGYINKTSNIHSSPIYYDGKVYFTSDDSNIYAVEVNTLTNVNNDFNSAPNSYKLGQNYPNPFNPTTRIEYQLSEKCFVTINVYNSLGEIVETLINETKSPGSHSLIFNASNLTSGIYIYTINAGNYRASKKMLLVK